MAPVSDLSLDREGAARAALADVVRGYGVAGLDDQRLMGQLLPDLMAGSEREAAVVLAAAGSKVGQLLAERIAHGLPVDSAIRGVAALLGQRHLFDPSACEWVVAEYALAMGLISTPPAPVPVPVPGPPPGVPGPGGMPMPRLPGDNWTVQAPGPVVVGATPRRTGFIVAIVVVAAVVVAAGIFGIVKIASPGAAKTGAACLVGTWVATNLSNANREVTDANSALTRYFKDDGTGGGHSDITSVPTSGDPVTTHFVGDFTFHYRATATTITYPDVAGSWEQSTDSDTTHGSFNFPDETYTCEGDSLQLTSESSSALLYTRQ